MKSAMRKASPVRSAAPAVRAGLAHGELRLEHHLAMRVFFGLVDLLEEELGCGTPEEVARLPDGGQWDGCRGGVVDVVVADDRHVLGHAEAAAGHLLQDAE